MEQQLVRLACHLTFQVCTLSVLEVMYVTVTLVFEHCPTSVMSDGSRFP